MIEKKTSNGTNLMAKLHKIQLQATNGPANSCYEKHRESACLRPLRAIKNRPNVTGKIVASKK